MTDLKINVKASLEIALGLFLSFLWVFKMCSVDLECINGQILKHISK